jgi:hypothetical protein
VAGGFDLPDATVYLLASKRVGPGTGWRLEVRNPADGGGATVAIRAHAYCDRAEPGLDTRSKTITADQANPFDQRAKASCRGKQALRSGGFETEYVTEDPAENSRYGIVHGSRKAGSRAWLVTAFAQIGSPQVTAYAYCER